MKGGCKVEESSTRNKQKADVASDDEVLVAVFDKSVWVRDGTSWIPQTEQPGEAQVGMCVCGVFDGIIALGGYALVKALYRTPHVITSHCPLAVG